MPRVFTVTKNKGGKEYKCSSCSKVIQAGEKYHYFTRYRASSKTIRCIDHYPKPSELTGSETLQIAYSVQESLDAIGYEYDDVISTLEDAYSEIEGLVDTLSDKVSNVEEAFPNGTPVLDQLQEYLENAESFRDSIEEAKSEIESLWNGFEGEEEPEEIEGDYDPENSEGLSEDEWQEKVDARDEWKSKKDGVLEEIQEVVSNISSNF